MILELLSAVAVFGSFVPSDIRVPKVENPSYHSVQFYDNLNDITNGVLSGEIRDELVRIHTNMQNGILAELSAKRNLQAVEQHCKQRLEADGLPVAECGNGF